MLVRTTAQISFAQCRTAASRPHAPPARSGSKKVRGGSSLEPRQCIEPAPAMLGVDRLVGCRGADEKDGADVLASSVCSLCWLPPWSAAGQWRPLWRTAQRCRFFAAFCGSTTGPASALLPVLGLTWRSLDAGAEPSPFTTKPAPVVRSSAHVVVIIVRFARHAAQDTITAPCSQCRRHGRHHRGRTPFAPTHARCCSSRTTTGRAGSGPIRARTSRNVLACMHRRRTPLAAPLPARVEWIAPRL